MTSISTAKVNQYLRVLPDTTLSIIEPDEAWASFTVGHTQSRWGGSVLLIEPSLAVQRNGQDVALSGLTVTPQDIGAYIVKFNAYGMEPGLYNWRLTGTWFDDNIEIKGDFELAPVSLTRYHLYFLRALLYDTDDTIYHVNPWAERHKWSDDLLSKCLSQALNRINRFRRNPGDPRVYSFNVDATPLPPEYNDILYAGARYHAYTARQTYEIPEAFTTAATVQTDYKREYTTLAKQMLADFDKWLDETFHWNDQNEGIYLGRGRNVFYWLTRAIVAVGTLRGTAYLL